MMGFGMVVASAGPYANNLHFRFRQITTPTLLLLLLPFNGLL